MAIFKLLITDVDSLRLRASDLPSGTTNINWYIGTSTSSMPYAGTSAVVSGVARYTFTDLDSGTSYYVKIKCLDEDGNSLGIYTSSERYSTLSDSSTETWQLGNTYTFSDLTQSKSQYLSFGKAGYVARFTMTFAYSGTATFYTIGDADTYGYLSDVSTLDANAGAPTDYLKSNDDGGDSYNFKITYSVTAGETYYLWVRMIDIDTTGTTTVVITPPIKQIDLWNWSVSNGDATASQTSVAYTAITNHGAVSAFSYLVWNDLVNKVNDIKVETGYSWNTKYLSLSNTLMTASSKTLTAARFNSLRYNIGIHESTGLNEVYTGDEVYGWYFTALTGALNTWIGILNDN